MLLTGLVVTKTCTKVNGRLLKTVLAVVALYVVVARVDAIATLSEPLLLTVVTLLTLVGSPMHVIKRSSVKYNGITEFGWLLLK